MTITDQALVASANLADRYISDRHLPDKAIDLIDEAGSRLRIKRMSTPPDLREIELKLSEVQEAKAVLSKNSASRRPDSCATRRRPCSVKAAKEQEIRGDSVDLFDEVDEEAIAEVLSVWTGIPVYKLTEEDAEADQHGGRAQADHRPAECPSPRCRSRFAGLRRVEGPKRPSGSFIFLGPTGVGKTELAKTLAEFLFGDDNALITLDMSEYMEARTVNRLVGSLQAYVGYEEGEARLTEAVRRKPFSVVLFDEIEKAHPDVFNTVLQILEEVASPTAGEAPSTSATSC